MNCDKYIHLTFVCYINSVNSTQHLILRHNESLKIAKYQDISMNSESD